MKKLILSVLLMALVKHSSGQALANLSAGAGISENIYLGLGPYTGFNLRAAYNLGDKGQAFLAFNYSFSRDFSYSADANALSSLTYPSYISVPYTDKIQLSELHLGYKILLGSENDDDFGFYLHAGLGIVFASVTTTISSYDHNLYNLSFVEGTVSEVGFVINAGFGLQYKVGPGYIFLDPRFSIPANRVNNSYVTNPIPISVGGILGYRIPFGSK